MLRRLRTFAALLFHVLLLQVSVLGGGMACAPTWADGVGAAAAGAPAAGGAHDAHDAHAGPGASADAARDAAPDAADDASGGASPHHGDVRHCATATGCAAVAVLGPVVTPAALAAVHARAHAAPVALPPSTRAAPEPPPPRA